MAALDSGLFYLGIPLGIVLILTVGFLFVVIYQQKTKNRFSEKFNLLQSQYKDISQSFKTSQEELARKKEIAESIPGIVRRLTENLPESAIPPIVVRFAKEFFHASRVGYFVRHEETGDYILRDGAGFPPDVMGRIRLPAREGILGTAVRKQMVASREDLPPSETRMGEPSSERARMEFDFVAPITVNSTTRGGSLRRRSPECNHREIIGVLRLSRRSYRIVQQEAFHAVVRDGDSTRQELLDPPIHLPVRYRPFQKSERHIRTSRRGSGLEKSSRGGPEEYPQLRSRIEIRR